MFPLNRFKTGSNLFAECKANIDGFSLNRGQFFRLLLSSLIEARLMYCPGKAVLSLQCVEEVPSQFLCVSWQEKSNEGNQMVAGGKSSVWGDCTRFQWGTQQGGIQVDSLSTGFEIQTQGIYCHSSVSPRFTALKNNACWGSSRLRKSNDLCRSLCFLFHHDDNFYNIFTYILTCSL